MFAKKSQVSHANSIHEIIRSIAARRDADGIVAIAHGLAKQIVSETNFAGQRKVQFSRKQEHLDNILFDRWIPELSEIVFAETPDGRLYLINGQHRLFAIHESGRAVKTRIQIIRAADMAGVRRLYASYDNPLQSRTDNEMLSGAGVSDQVGLKPATVTALYKALSIVRNNMEPAGNRVDTTGARSRSGRLDELPDWVREAKLYEGIVAKADKYIARKMMGQGCMASALFLLRHQKAKATEFLSGVAENDGLRKLDPRARLITDFQQRALNAGGVRQSVQQVAVAWNAFAEGRDLSFIRCAEGGPIVFKGTPKGVK